MVPVQAQGPGLGPDQKQLKHVEEGKNVKASLRSSIPVILVNVSIIFTSDPFSKKNNCFLPICILRFTFDRLWKCFLLNNGFILLPNELIKSAYLQNVDFYQY